MTRRLAVIRPGVHTLDEQFCYYLARHGYSVTLVAPQNSAVTPNRINHPNFDICLLPSLKLVADFPIIPGLYKYLKSGNFDLVQSNEDFQFITWVAAFFSRRHHKKFVLIEEKYFYPRFVFHRLVFRLLSRLTFPYVLKSASKIICHSRACRDFILSRVSDAEIRKKTVFLPVGVNPAVFRPPSRLHHRDHTLKVITVGRLIYHKDYPTLLLALSRLIRRGQNVHLTIVGRGPLRPVVASLIRRYRLSDHVTLVDSIPFEQLAGIYAAHDLFVLSSILEVIGAVILEAMACGLPVVISRTGGMPDYVRGGVNGFIFRPGDDLDLCRKIEKISDGNLVAYGRQSLKLVRKFFDWDVVIMRYLKYLS